MLRNKYQSRNLIGHYPFWVISPRNSTSFTRPFLAGRRARAGHETRLLMPQVLQPRPFCHVNPPRVEYNNLLHTDSHESVAPCSGCSVIVGKGEPQLHAPARRPTPVIHQIRLLWIASHFSCMLSIATKPQCFRNGEIWE